MAEYPGAARILLKRALAAKMSRDELVQKVRAAGIKDGEHPRQFFRRLGFEYDLKEEKLNEELTRQDKTDVKKMVQDELEKLLKKKDTKDQMGEIVKKIMKKLYKDLSLEHPYIIDRIKIWCYIIDVIDDNTDPFVAQYDQAVLGDWVYYPKTKLCGLVIGLDNQTGFMQIHCFRTMNLRWVTSNNFGQYKVLWVKVI